MLMMDLCGTNMHGNETNKLLMDTVEEFYRFFFSFSFLPSPVIGDGKLQIKKKYLGKWNSRDSQYYSNAQILKITTSALVFSTAELFWFSCITAFLQTR